MKKLIKNTTLIITGLVVGVMVGRCREIRIDSKKMIELIDFQNFDWSPLRR